ncbi:MAG: hypothetical protein PHC64_06790, partial [Candidatus Gastranaerophilales bacterium]|nr:hypothetical protein [Candidatus Gastranaerophilales bacterium]
LIRTINEPSLDGDVLGTQIKAVINKLIELKAIFRKSTTAELTSTADLVPHATQTITRQPVESTLSHTVTTQRTVPFWAGLFERLRVAVTSVLEL